MQCITQLPWNMEINALLWLVWITSRFPWTVHGVPTNSAVLTSWTWKSQRRWRTWWWHLHTQVYLPMMTSAESHHQPVHTVINRRQRTVTKVNRAAERAMDRNQWRDLHDVSFEGWHTTSYRHQLYGGDRPHSPQVMGAMPSSHPTGILLLFFETVKCTVKIRIHHYASDKSCADFSLIMHQKRLAARLRQDSASPDLLAGFKSRAGTREWGRGKDRREWTAEGGGQRKEGRSGREWRKGEKGMRRGREISLPRSFLKVGAYATSSHTAKTLCVDYCFVCFFTDITNHLTPANSLKCFKMQLHIFCICETLNR